MAELQLGNKIQTLRTQRSISMRRLSTLAGITPSMLSQIENEQVNPSINTLRSIAQALEVPLYVLFQDTPAADPVVHPENRLIIGSKAEPDVHCELLTADTGGDIEFCIMVLPPRQSSYRHAMSHAGEEVDYLLSGECIQLDLDGTVYTLKPGDSIRIPPNAPHVWHNPTDTTAQLIFAITPPTF